MRIDGQLVNAGTEVVSSLPNTGLFYGRQVILNTTDTLYVYDGAGWIAIGSGGGGAETFLDLTDTPSTYAGSENDSVFVNAGGDGITYRPPEFTQSIDVPSNYGTFANSLVAVAPGENGLVFIDSEFISQIDTPTDYTGQAGKQVLVKGDETGLEFLDAAAGGATVFTGLNDTPANYTGEANKFLAVNATEDGVEFVNAGAGGATVFTGLNDTPADYIGQTGKSVVVNGTEDGLEFVDASGGSSIPPSPQTGRFFMAWGTGQDEYEWTDILRYNDLSIKMFVNADMQVSGTLNTSSGGDISSANKLISSGDAEIGGNCDASSYTTGGMPLAASVISQASSLYEDKFLQSVPLDPAPNSTTILMSFSDLTIGNWYTVTLSLVMRWVSQLLGTGHAVNYDLKLSYANNVIREINDIQNMNAGQIMNMPWSSSLNFQAEETAIHLVVKTKPGQLNIASGQAIGIGMTLEEFNPQMRVETSQW